MRDDPFAELGGLDQKLFSSPSGLATRQGRKAAHKGGRTSEGPSGRPDVRTERRTSGRRDGGTNDASSERRNVPTKVRRLSRPRGSMSDRPSQRHPYDIFRDQILWLNKTKVSIQERHGCVVTANAMVQLALDLLIDDYKEKKDRSELITRLVLKR